MNVQISNADSIFFSIKLGWSFMCNICTECYLYITIRRGRLIDIMFLGNINNVNDDSYPKHILG